MGMFPFVGLAVVPRWVAVPEVAFPVLVSLATMAAVRWILVHVRHDAALPADGEGAV